jgi:hypothetical protein
MNPLLETYLEIARRLGFFQQQEFDELMPALNSTGRLLSALFRSLDARSRA